MTASATSSSPRASHSVPKSVAESPLPERIEHTPRKRRRQYSVPVDHPAMHEPARGDIVTGNLAITQAAGIRLIEIQVEERIIHDDAPRVGR